MFVEKRLPAGWQSWKKWRADWVGHTTALLLSAAKQYVATRRCDGGLTAGAFRPASNSRKPDQPTTTGAIVTNERRPAFASLAALPRLHPPLQ